MPLPVLAPLLLSSLFISLPAQAQTVAEKAVRMDMLDKLAHAVEQRYLTPAAGRAMADDLRARRARGEYVANVAPREFAQLVTAQLQAISHDKHIQLNCRDKAGGKRITAPAAQAPGENRLGKISILPGNIGYVEVLAFEPRSPEVDQAIADAMTMVADTSALIFDLRGNGGGEPETVALLASYLFDQPVLLNEVYGRNGNKVEEYRTLASVAGKRYGRGKAVYVLTGKLTFSAGEEFAYDLQALRRAVVVGAVTPGGANPGDIVQLPGYCGVFVPDQRVVNPVTKTSWEGKGVQPDVVVDEGKALEEAQALILRKSAAS